MPTLTRRAVACGLLAAVLAPLTAPLSAADIGAPGGAKAPPARAVVSHPQAAEIAEAARRFGIAEAWIAAVIAVESAGDPNAVSSAGAMGLMQLMPATYAELRRRYRLGADPFEPRDNVLAGTAYLRELLDRFGVAGAFAAYNAGPTRYGDYLAGRRSLPASTIHAPSGGPRTRCFRSGGPGDRPRNCPSAAVWAGGGGVGKVDRGLQQDKRQRGAASATR